MSRRTVLALALSAAALAVPAGTAAAAPTATLTAGATLLDQPQGRPWALGLDVDSAIALPDGSQPSALKKVQIKFPHATVNWDDFASCQLSRLEGRKDADGCPAGSRIGKGTARVMARPLFPDPIPATIEVFNGKAAKGGGQQILFLAKTGGGLDVQLVFAGALKRLSGGRYGFALDLGIPRIPTIPGVPDASVVGFSVHVEARRRKGGRKVSFIEAPTSCPSGGLPFLGTFSFADGSSASSASKIACTLRSTPA